MRLSFSAVRSFATIITQVWLVDETQDPPEVQPPSKIRSVSVSLRHNNHVINTAEADRYNGNDDGSFKFVVLNSTLLTGLNVDVELTDTSGTVYSGHRPVMKDTDLTALPRNRVDVP